MTVRASLLFSIAGFIAVLQGATAVTSSDRDGLSQAAAAQPASQDRQHLEKAMREGQFKEAYEGYRLKVIDPRNDPVQAGNDLRAAVECLRQLGRVAEIDGLRDEGVSVHGGNWQFLLAAAETLYHDMHHGHMIAGRFERGHHRGGGEFANSEERDRTTILSWMHKAAGLMDDSVPGELRGRFHLAFARFILFGRSHHAAWKLQTLTNLAELPDYETGTAWGHDGPGGAAVDQQNNPVFHLLPTDWNSSRSDGERWRFQLAEAARHAPGLRAESLMDQARFLHEQFGVQTLVEWSPFFARQAADETGADSSGTFALHTLGDDETIARLATGIKRFPLPEEQNFIRLFRQIYEQEDPRGGFGRAALTTLAQIYENRRQYPKAAEAWRRHLGSFADDKDLASERLNQIVANWGRFEPVSGQPAGRGAAIEYRFRNGRQVSLTAQSIDVARLLADVKAYLNSHPAQLEWNQVQIEDLGHRLVTENQVKYLSGQVAAWQLPLEPAADHFDRRITITTPLQKPGAYLVTARMDGGNTSHVIVWVHDLAIIKKPLDGKILYLVTDAVTGRPVDGAHLELFGFQQVHEERNRVRLLTRNRAERTDEQGQAVHEVREDERSMQWMVLATVGKDRLAYLGFTGAWTPRYLDPQYDQVKVLAVTDRPVYRPQQQVKFKFWVRRATYEQDRTDEFAGQALTVEIHNSKSEKVLSVSKTSDAYGGIEGTFDLPSGAALGVYQLNIVGLGGGSFRVEEYKKPEFEVKVESPERPVMLGDPITAVVRAQYYFGAPVTQAKVRVKVMRTGSTDAPFPVARWDWLYGPGYWWPLDDQLWYPGWENWGCLRPLPPWWHRHEQPEIVSQFERPIGPDGTIEVRIETRMAKELHPDKDHTYSITAEVVDASRRTIVGQGTVLVARKPFRVFAWVDRGHYRTGETVRARFAARTADGKPVQGTARASLYSIRYDTGRRPVETLRQEWDVTIDSEGSSELAFEASDHGQYRIACRVTDGESRTIEGAALLTVIGQGNETADFRFNDLEISTDRLEYAVGDKALLQIRTNRAQSNVFLFLRPVHGTYLPPKVLALEGKTAEFELPIVRGDMPNFFVEAVTVAEGRVHTVVRQVYVPPESKVLDLKIESVRTEYKPGERAKVTWKLTGPDGRPFVGSTVVSVYDKAVEYISGGSNVPEMKEHFWKWRREHYPQSETNLMRLMGNLVRPGEKSMSNLGIFGDTVPEETEGSELGFPVLALERDSRLMSARGRYIYLGGDFAAAPAAARADDAYSAKSASVDSLESAGGEPLVEPTLRTQFADTALWIGSLETNSDGLAEAEFEVPENLTTWKAKVWAMGRATQVGEGSLELISRKDLIVRLQAPRFFVEKDEVVLSANVHNGLEREKQVRVVLELAGETLSLTGEAIRVVSIPAGGEARVDWTVRAEREGRATVRMKALTDEESDAMQMEFPVFVHGMLKMDSYSGVIDRGEESGRLLIDVPSARRSDPARLEVAFSPSLAGAMVDALPYLVEYPYGCTEQTLNRFLPTVITQRVLMDLGLDLQAIAAKRVNLNPQELGDPGERARGWQRYERQPVFDVKEVERMVKEGVTALSEMQLTDGGWGWFSGWGERSSPHTTAVVVHGLQLAQANDVPLLPNVLERGVAWLKAYQDEQVRRLQNAKTEEKPYKQSADNTDALVYMVLVDSGVADPSMMEFLYRDRLRLAPYSWAMFGLALHKQGETEKRNMLIRNLEQRLVEDAENQTAYLELSAGNWWYWYGSEYETQAYYLKLLAATDPQGRTASRLVKYLLNNRKHASYWNSTRDTAAVIEAMAEYVKASGESKPNMVVEVWVDGSRRKEVSITPENLFAMDNRLAIEGADLTSGRHTVELRRHGEGRLYYNAYATYFSLEDPIPASGLELKVERKYYRLEPIETAVQAAGSRGQALDQAVEKFRRHELPSLATVTSGDLVEIELVVHSKNDYEYIVLEDAKAAGLEPLALQSGYDGNALGAYIEYRDERVALFARHIARGTHSVSYRMRAEIPGRFSALPTRAYAMYAPELKANADEMKLGIGDSAP